jgi:predicted RecA/RadA family phage recombinase
MRQPGDKPFGIVAALAVLSGAAVMIPSLAVVAVTLIAVVFHLL